MPCLALSAMKQSDLQALPTLCLLPPCKAQAVAYAKQCYIDQRCVCVHDKACGLECQHD